LDAPQLTVCVLSDADFRAASLTLRSLLNQAGAAPRILLLLSDRPVLRRSVPSSLDWIPPGIEPVWVPADVSTKNAALAAAATDAAEVVVLAREGLVFEPGLGKSLLSRFAANARLSAGMLDFGRGGSNINDFSGEQLASADPWSLVPETPGYDNAATILKARYLRPCLLAVRASFGRTHRFEEFSSLGDWYAYRRFLLGVPAEQKFEESSRDLGYIGRVPDRRDPYAQGKDAVASLYRISAGYPEFQSEVRADFRTLLRSQLSDLVDSARAKSARQFLGGMMAERLAQRALRKRVQRDIAELS
jgi:hypothetical protein